MNWSQESLWSKATLYMARASSEQREGPLFAFWSILGLEILARATLAKVHPVLLADPLEGGDNVFYALGYGAIKPPKSIPIKTVLTRCQRVVPDFTKNEFDLCMVWVGRRNEEVHTGAAAFEAWSTGLWLAEFYRICNLLVRFQDKELAELFGEDEASGAQVMITSLEDEKKKVSLDAISSAQKAFDKLGSEEKSSQRAKAEQWTAELRVRFKKIISCPACGSPGALIGKRVTSTEPRLIETDIVQETVVIPTSFRCVACGLQLEGHNLLHPAELGGQFVVRELRDPVEYLDIDVMDYFDPSDYFGEEYGNE